MALISGSQPFWLHRLAAVAASGPGGGEMVLCAQPYPAHAQMVLCMLPHLLFPIFQSISGLATQFSRGHGVGVVTD